MSNARLEALLRRSARPKNKIGRRNGEVAQKTVSRRSVIEWMGRSAVLVLGAELVAACETSGGATGGSDAAGGGSDAVSGGADIWTPSDIGGGGPDGMAPEDVGLPRDEGSSPGPDAPHGEDLAGEDAGGPDVPDPDVATTGDYPFSPGGSDGPFPAWSERTVDRQDLVELLANWELRVDGLVGTPVTLSFAELVQLPRKNQVKDFHCVEGWSVHEVPWNGIHLADLFDLVDPDPSATHVVFHTVGGTYNESLPIDIAREPSTMLGYGIGGNTLPLSHGFPLRVVIPRLLGYKNAKYVERIELTTAPLNGFWVNAGYAYDGNVPADRLREGWY